MPSLITQVFNRFFRNIFRNRSHVKLGLYGPPNAGKSTLANQICKDWLNEEMSTVSNVPHETREIQIKEEMKDAKIIFMKGPLGYSEIKDFSYSTVDYVNIFFIETPSASATF